MVEKKRSLARVTAAVAATFALVATPLLGSVVSVPTAHALDNDLAKTPPMGWNSWNQVRCYDLTEDLVRSTIDAIAERGLAEKGYQYVTIDDCWQGGRDPETHELFVHPERFKTSIKDIADYAHSKGLKLGLYMVPGSETCANKWDRYPIYGLGSYGYEAIDAKSLEKWGVDFLKYDWCRADVTEGLKHQDAFKKMRDELAKLDREIVYGISEYGDTRPWEWAQDVANMWRTTHDINPTWDSVANYIIEGQAALAGTSKPGAWNDPDMLQIGNGNFANALNANRLAENRTHFGMWSMLAAPLFLGTSVAKLPEDILQIIGNERVIAVDQDPLGVQARRVFKDSLRNTQVWARPLANGDVAVALMNKSLTRKTISTNLWQVKAASSAKIAQNLWTGEDLPNKITGEFSVEVDPHDTVLLRLRATDGEVDIPEDIKLPEGTFDLTTVRPTEAIDGWREIKLNRSIGGGPLVINGVEYATGFGTNANSYLRFRLAGQCQRLTGRLGVDDDTQNGDERWGRPTINGRVSGDNQVLWKSDGIIRYQQSQTFDVDLTGVDELELNADVGGDTNAYDHADWVELQLTCNKPVEPSPEPSVEPTVEPSPEPGEPGEPGEPLPMQPIQVSQILPPAVMPFRDVNSAAAFAGEINWMHAVDITRGWSDGTFRPLSPVTREAMAAFIYRLAGSPYANQHRESAFKDVPANHQFAKEIAWLGESGISRGWPDGTFRPGEPVSREAMAAFLHRMCTNQPQLCAPAFTPERLALSGPMKFKDVPGSHPFAADIKWLAQAKVTTGWPDGSFRPQQPIARDAMAAFFYRLKNNY